VHINALRRLGKGTPNQWFEQSEKVKSGEGKKLLKKTGKKERGNLFCRGN
jgi:hypothetical protein